MVKEEDEDSSKSGEQIVETLVMSIYLFLQEFDRSCFVLWFGVLRLLTPSYHFAREIDFKRCRLARNTIGWIGRQCFERRCAEAD